MTTTPKGVPATQLELTRYVHILFIGGGAVAVYLAYRIVHSIWIRFSPDPSFPLLFAISLAVGGGLALYFWQQERVRQLAQEAVTELSRVTWPTRPELRAATVVVIITSIIMAIILGLMDFVWSRLTGLIY